MNTKFLFVWLIAGLLEVPFLRALLQGELPFRRGPLLLSLALHSVSVAILASFGIRNLSQNRKHWAWAFGILMSLFPFYGWLGCGFLFLAYRPDKISQPRYLEIKKGTMAPEEAGFAISRVRMSREERILRELDMIPLVDILSGGDLSLKRGAIEKLSGLKTREATALLLKHRSDPEAEVRFYVTSALTMIKKEQNEELERKKEKMRQNFNDLEARISLAKGYLQYVDLGLLDPSSSEIYIREAVHHLHFVLKHDPAPMTVKEVLQLLLKVKLTQKEWKNTLDLMARDGTDQKIGLPDLGKILASLYYQIGDYRKFMDQLFRMKEGGFPDSSWKAVAQWWGVCG